MTTTHIRAGGGLITDIHTTEIVPVGTCWRDPATGTGYVFVYNAGADSSVLGEVMGVFSTTYKNGHISTTAATMLDYDDAGDIVSHVAGVCLGVIATTEYAWIWADGPSLTHKILTDGTIAAGDGLVLDDGLSLATTEVETQDHGNFGFAHVADDASNELLGATLRNTAFWRP